MNARTTWVIVALLGLGLGAAALWRHRLGERPISTMPSSSEARPPADVPPPPVAAPASIPSATTTTPAVTSAMATPGPAMAAPGSIPPPPSAEPIDSAEYARQQAALLADMRERVGSLEKEREAAEQRGDADEAKRLAIRIQRMLAAIAASSGDASP